MHKYIIVYKFSNDCISWLVECDELDCEKKATDLVSALAQIYPKRVYRVIPIETDEQGVISPEVIEHSD